MPGSLHALVTSFFIFWSSRTTKIIFCLQGKTGKRKILKRNKILCAITLNYCTYTYHVGVPPRALYCVVDTSYGLGRSLGHCRPALPKGRKYQMVKTQTQSHDRRPVVWTNRWQIWVFFSFEFLRGTAGICHKPHAHSASEPTIQFMVY